VGILVPFFLEPNAQPISEALSYGSLTNRQTLDGFTERMSVAARDAFLGFFLNAKTPICWLTILSHCCIEISVLGKDLQVSRLSSSNLLNQVPFKLVYLAFASVADYIMRIWIKSP
jgi:hypothetical protein